MYQTAVFLSPSASLTLSRHPYTASASAEAPVAIPATPLPPTDATAGDIWQALEGQTTQLDQANGRTSDLIEIADSCQKRQVAVLNALNPPPWYAKLILHRKAP